MASYFHLLLPELVLGTVACVLVLLGCSNRASSRHAAPLLALITLVAVFVMLCFRATSADAGHTLSDSAGTLRLFHFSQYVKLLTAAVGAMLLLLSWPTNSEGTGNSAMNVGQESGEFFGLMLLSLTGIFLVAGANDLILLFLGIELASIPTYVMVSISRPLPVAQEAGVKYFFLGAMAAAVMLFGFSYLYGVTGSIKLDVISRALHPAVAGGVASTGMAPWQILAVVMLIAGFGFKIAAVPMHVYAGDVYQGAATPVTAFLSFVPKTSGIVALVKILFAVGGMHWAVPPQVVKLLWVLAALTMTFGNVLALPQYNVKRLFAYSSIAHSGYMLVGLTALAGAYGNGGPGVFETQQAALQGVLFYLTAYGVTNAAAFGVLMMLPSRDSTAGRPATSAETIEDLAGQGRKHPALGLCMTVCCLSLIGIPLTVGFIGKLLLIKPALSGGFVWLAIITVVNAAISAAYYLRIVATMFLRDPATNGGAEPVEPAKSFPIAAAIALSVGGTLLLGVVLPLTQIVATGAQSGAQVDDATLNAPAKVAVR
jgi:NADH-quinone oxidoreductase subunit N